LSEDRNTRDLPVRTLHEFLVEISNEWNRFRNGSLLSIITTIILFVLFIPRFFLSTLRRGGPFDTLLALGIIAALLYNIYLSYKQHQFYQKWEKRIGLLLHIEEELLNEEV
jgi:RsiW-degrading membrane proteinase PrsW (M82 family)